MPARQLTFLLVNHNITNNIVFTIVCNIKNRFQLQWSFEPIYWFRAMKFYPFQVYSNYLTSVKQMFIYFLYDIMTYTIKTRL